MKTAGVSLIAAVVLSSTALPCRAQVNENQCGALQNAIGPWDYRVERGNVLKMVEDFHFTRPVEMALRGHSGYLGGDLDYTLRAFPNHHRALLAVGRYGDRVKMDKPPDLPRAVECYFERAVRFKPDDTVARVLYARYLSGKKRNGEAGQQLAAAAEAAKDNPFAHYNIGLAYAEIGEYDKALVQAHAASALGLNRSELREQLVKAGKWKEPEPDAAAVAAAAASAASGAASAAAAPAASSGR